MAEHSHGTDYSVGPHTDRDLEEHRRTYVAVLKVIKWGSIAAAIVLVFLFWLAY